MSRNDGKPRARCSARGEGHEFIWLGLAAALAMAAGAAGGPVSAAEPPAPEEQPVPPAVTQEMQPRPAVEAAEKRQDGGAGIRVPHLQESKTRPFNGFATGNLWRNGPLGFMDLSLGLSAGDGAILNNLALNGGMMFNPWMRAHLTAVARPGNWNLSPSHLVQEGYFELSERDSTPGGGSYIAGVRLGKVQNLAFSPGPLSLFEQVPYWEGNRLGKVPGYGEIVPFVDFQSKWGLGFNFAMNTSILGDQRGMSPINGYLRLRAIQDSGYMMELRGGWLTSRSIPSIGLLPREPGAGTALYVGKQWKSGAGIGIAFEQTLDEPFRVGARLSVPTNTGSQALGNFLARARTGSPSFSAQLPLARLNLGEQNSTPPPGGQLVGTVRMKRVYRTASGIGASQFPINDEYEISREGETRDGSLVRVVTEGPRALTGFGGLIAPEGGDLYNNEYVQDVVHTYYRVVPFSDTWLQGKVYDREDPARVIQNLTLRLKSPGHEQALTPQNGDFKVQRKLPAGKRQNITVIASAPGYLEESFEAKLAPGATETVEIPLRPLRSGAIGRLLDAETGKPIPEVEALLTRENGQTIVLLTDAEGEFRLPELQPGTYGFATHAPRHHDERLDVKIDPGQTQRLEFRLKPRPASVIGRILGANDQPVAGARVTITGADGASVEAATVGDGSYGATGLKAGKYTVGVTSAAGEKVEKTIVVMAGEVLAVDLRLK